VPSSKKMKGRGEGWMLIGPAGMAEYMPKDHPGYPIVVQYLEELADALRRYQDPQTGLWHNIIDDPYTRLEASGTAMIVNAYCRAYRAGVCRTPEVKETLTRAGAHRLPAHVQLPVGAGRELQQGRLLP
jgi:rhamnogalacturonyl hydrolase YesR